MITVSLITVRPDAGYLEHPQWTTLGKIFEDLEQQTFKDFELVVADGLYWVRTLPRHSFPVTHVLPRGTVATRNKKVAIAAYRNTTLIHARGELIVSIDDCCELPPNFLEAYWYAWSKHRVCISMTWPEQGDVRRPGRVTEPGQVYGFGSYPLEAAIALNGVDEAYDLGQGLEDADWSTRLLEAGVQMGLVNLPGFRLHAQSAHAPLAIDVGRPLVKCCNLAWNAQRRERNVHVANTADLWPREWVRKLLGPCVLLRNGRNCGFHDDGRVCAYITQGFALTEDPVAALLYDDPPVLDLAKARQKE